MESHPLTKVVVGLLGLGIVAVAVWIGRSGGNLPVDGASTHPESIARPDDAKPPKEEHERPPISPTGPYPKAVVDEAEHQFSVMAVGSDGTHSFTVRNEGEAPLILSKGPSTCKCTVSDLAANQVPPGGSAQVNLTWNAREAQPMFRETATIYTNDPEMKEFELSISGRVTQTIEVSPPGTWSIDDFVEGSESSVTGAVFSYVLDSFEFEEMQTSSDSLAVEFAPMSPERLEASGAKSGYLITAKLKPDIPVGTFREKLTFTLKSKEVAPIEVFVEGKRTGPISFLGARGTRWNPNAMALNLGEFDASQGAAGTLLLFVRGQEDEELEIVSVESDPDVIQVELTPDRDFQGQGRKKYELEIKVPAGSPSRTRSGDRPARIILKTNHPEAAELKFRVDYISR